MKTTLLLIISILTISLTGCSKQNKPTAPSLAIQSTIEQTIEATETVPSEELQPKVKNKDLITQAKQQILAVPVGYKLKGYAESNNTTKHSEHFIYEGSLNMAQVIKFYQKELELNGWIYENISTKKEGLLVADKFSKKCVISVRQIKANTTTIHVFIKDKQASTNSNNFVNLNCINKNTQPW
ncbi:MAG: hypothetical protein US49_C0005G0065 [candidate division TM6 bacterium GW2011_GWF2_37_49]|nr:MAG: hypothetical protein US49_C0005G0065 [candidate division TM6 bacterium GW2011_GWF2_37_49]